MARKSYDYTADDLARQAEAAAELVAFLRTVDEDDDDLIEDSIEGETDFKEAIDEALERIAEAEMMAGAIKERVAKLIARKKRFEENAGFFRHCIQMALAQANGDRELPFTLTTPAATVTLREGKVSVIIEDEDKLPSKYWRTPDPVIDKKKLNEDCLAPGADLPDGVSLSEKGFTLAIRRG